MANPLSPEDRARLVRVRDRIADPARWTQGYMARNAKGRPVQAWSTSATCWCLFGAWIREDGPDGYALDNALGIEDAVALNDRRTHAEVLQAIDRVLEGHDGE